MPALLRSVGAFALLALPAVAAAYRADLVPASTRPESRELSGSLAITGPDGNVRVVVAGIADASGAPLDEAVATLEMRVKTNGRRRRLTIPVELSDGAGAATESLGLRAGATVVVLDVRLRGPNRHLLAQAGSVTAEAPPAPVPPPDQCLDALEGCQGDLADCREELEDCESSL
jgi:hypothetical protein